MTAPRNVNLDRTGTHPVSPWWSIAGWTTAHVLRSFDWTLCGREIPKGRNFVPGVGDRARCGQCLRRDPYFEETR